MVVWLHIHDSKCIVRIYGIAAKCVICDVDIHPDVDYTCHDDPSLYVASLVTLGSHLKYDRQIHALQVLRSFHIVLMTLKESRGILIAVGIIRNCCCITVPSELTIGAMFR